MAIIKLNAESMNKFSEEVVVPKYDRSKVNVGIVHIGIGGFHRAHQALYVDQLLHITGNENWGICGIALREHDKKIFNTLKEQDGLYTLVIKELDGSQTTTIVGSIVEYLFAPEVPQVVIEKMAKEAIKIITLTITEGGYNYNETTKEFDFKNPLIQYDLENPSNPKTVFGYITQALKLRKERNLKGLAIQSCDNIQGNGHVMQRMLISFVEKAEPQLVEWIKSNVSFPNSMVDRITPVTTQLDIEELKETFEIDDSWPVVCEPFKQWIIEDDFAVGRPAWETVGAQFVENVAPYEKMKLTLLNAGHTVLGVLGALIGYDTIDQAVNNKNLSTFLRYFMDVEVTPHLGDVVGINLTDYKNLLLERFGNINIRDQIDRICSESSTKIPIFILPTVKAQLEKNASVKASAFVIAAWAIYNLGLNENGKTLHINDEIADELHARAIEATYNPRLFLEDETVFGNLQESSKFIEAYTDAYRNIMKFGIEKSLIKNDWS